MSQTDIYILSGARTPIGKLMGSFATKSATDLGAVAIKAAVERAGIDPAAIDEVLMGHVVQGGAGQAPARQAAIKAGIPGTVSATTINKVCGSGLKTVMLAANAIHAGQGDLYVAGGMESMSDAPHFVKGVRAGNKYGNMTLQDANAHDGLWCSIEEWMMGDAAEFIADEFEVTREAMDDLAYKSHMNAVDAMENGRFKDEIAPVTVKTRKAEIIIDTDEAPRPSTSIEALAKLRPAFRKDGRVTPGNAPGLNDGGAAVVVASADKAEELGATPLARIVAYGQAAVEPKWLFAAPAKAMPIALERAGWTLDDVDLIELNEAFAAQVLANAYEMTANGHNWDWDKVNVNGGSIALGHPVGCSGARVLITLIYALQQRGLKRGLASLCLGGGEAVAMAIELV